MAAIKQHEARAGDGIVVRSPLLPATLLAEWSAERDVAAARRFLQRVIALPEVDEALYVASPALHAAVPAYLAAPESAAGQRVEHALTKYVARMAARSTPFGLFSAVSAGTLGRATKLELAPRSEYRRRTRLDNDYLFSLAYELERSPAIRDRLVWRPNTTLYRIGDRLRYAAARLVGQERQYELVAVEPTAYLDATLARAAGGARLETLAAALVDDVTSVAEARAYVGELIAAQVLVSELGVHVTGPEPLDGFIAVLEKGGLAEPLRVLREVRGALAAIDARGCGNAVDAYAAIAAQLTELPATVDPARLFQVDLVKPAAATLGTRVAADVAQAIAALARISGASEHDALGEFRRAYGERYGAREVPLVEVLDDESGIGFEPLRGPGSEGSPLLAGLAFAGGDAPSKVAWSAAHDHLLRRFAEVIASGGDELALADADLDAMAVRAPAELPDAFGALVRVAGTDDDAARGELAVALDGVAGPSGARLLGRFCHASADIDAIVRAHHAAEEALRPDAIFAEVVHLNEGRIGNVLCRPVLREHEIVFLGISGAARGQQILLDDLVVSVVGDRIVLRSRRLGREVIPRLSTAHNFWVRSLGPYRFLGALAGQGVATPRWSWGVLEAAPFLPRVRLGRVVIERARWNLGVRDLAPITAAVKAAAPERRARVLAAIAELRTQRRMPRHVVLAAGDNELPVDLDNPLLAAAFADELAGQRAATLKEMFPAPDRLVVHGAEGRFANEIVLTFTRTRPPARAVVASRPPATTRRTFAPGSEWLYAKIYCGESTADRVLRDVIAPIVRDAVASGDVDHWHFLRFADPEPHVRVRFHGAPARLTARVLPALERAVQHRLVLDTYERELERYGGDAAIETVEHIFWRDSEAVLGVVELLDDSIAIDARWRLALRGMDTLLAALGFDPSARARIAQRGRDGLGREHRADAALWSKIGERFTRERASLEQLFAPDPVRDADHDLAPGFELFAARDAHLARLGATLDEDVAWSLAHMHANRLLHASHRAQEMVLWDLLRRLHAGHRARGAAR